MYIVLETEVFDSIEFITEVNNVIEFISTEYDSVEFVTEQININALEFLTERFRSIEFVTEISDEDTSIVEKRIYPTWLENYRQEAISLMYSQITTLLSKAYTNEDYGKPDNCNYEIGLKFSALIDYLSIISLQMRDDEESNIEREDGYLYYYTLYDIDCIINSFKCKNINIKPLLTIFHIDEYNPSEFDFDSFTEDV